MKKNRNDVALKDTENYEGYMLTGKEEFDMLVKNKAVDSFIRAESKSKPAKIDLMLTKLYLAL